MSKKHFIKLAAALKASKPLPVDRTQTDLLPDAEYVSLTSLTQWRIDVRAVADVCASFNGNFDRVRFLSACGLDS